MKEEEDGGGRAGFYTGEVVEAEEGMRRRQGGVMRLKTFWTRRHAKCDVGEGGREALMQKVIGRRACFKGGSCLWPGKCRRCRNQLLDSTNAQDPFF